MSVNQPVYLQLVELVRDKINQGEYSFGDSIPSEREIAEQYGINRMTVRKALDILVDEMLLVRIQGKGTFVRMPKLVQDMRSIGGFSEFLEGRGITVTNQLLHSGVRRAGWKFSGIFSIPDKDEVFECVRTRLGDGTPYALEYLYIPNSYVDNFPSYDLKVYSLYDIYAKNNINIVRESQLLELVSVRNPQAKLLGVEEGAHVFLVTSDSIDSRGRVVEHARVFYNSEKFTYSAVTE